MTVTLENVSRLYAADWVVKDYSNTFSAGNSYALLGPNGSGKSTLLQLIARFVTPSEGKVIWKKNGKEIPLEETWQHLAICTPYMSLPEELTLTESVDFHFSLKRPGQKWSNDFFYETLQLNPAKNKPVRHFSSGMKQRLKLLLAIASDSSVLLLDEPLTNLDKAGTAWYLNLMEKFTQERLLMVASNNPEEYDFISNRIFSEDFSGRKRR